MYFLQKGIPFVRFLIFFMSGIAIGIFHVFSIERWMLFTVVVLYFGVYFFEKRYRIGISIRSFLAWTMFLFFGCLLVEVNTETNSEKHFIHNNDSIMCYQAKAITSPENTENMSKVIVEVLAIKTGSKGWFLSNGKLLIYLGKRNPHKIEKGDLILVIGRPSIFSPPKNPGQFDYADYMARQNIFATHFIKENNFLKVGFIKSVWWIQLADDFRSFCERKLKEGIKNEDEYYLTVALLLGTKNGLDEKLYAAYSETGTVHALAVSGLHVSLIYFIVVFLFGFLKKIKYGKYVFALISIGIFWFYALVTGFSPSVVRAVTMFSFFLLAGILKRNAGIYNTLAFSAFVILCVEPYWLLDIGFQFSFLAVLGIAYIYPIIYSSFEYRNYILDKFWSLVCLSIAAQLAVSPLSIYYFHSFPVLFLPFNMVIVPLSSLALYTGLISLILCKVDFLFDIGMAITEFLVQTMNYSVQLPSGFRLLKVDFILFTKLEIVLLYLFISFLFFALKNKVYKSFVFAWGWLFLFLISFLANGFLSYYNECLTVYHVKGNTVLSFINRGKCIIVSDSMLSKTNKNYRFNIYNHLAENRIEELSFALFGDTSVLESKNYPFGQLIVWRGIKILRIDKDQEEELPIDFLSNLDYLLISNVNYYERIKLEETGIKKPKIIVDATLRNIIKKEEKSDFHFIQSDGAFVWKRW